MGRLWGRCGCWLFVCCMAFPVVGTSHTAEATTNPFSSQLIKPKAKASKQATKSAQQKSRKKTANPKSVSATKATQLPGSPVPKLLDILRTSEGRFAVFVLEGRTHLAPEGARVGQFRVELIGRRQVRLQLLSSEPGGKPKMLVLKSR
ncbi:MAG: hypothetical protein QF922_05100 [SAR324 cluster bacterium]|nr:hypothetical protein [SAR324 cluster bacterium]